MLNLQLRAFPSLKCLFLPFGSDPLVWCDVNGVGDRVVPDGQAQVSDGTRAILLHQDVLGLQVSVSDPRFS